MKKSRRKARAERREAQARDPKEQLAHLDAMGFKAVKERAKLARKLST